MKLIEGDLILTEDGSIFDVKGLVHPPDKIIAFPRFILDPSGNRKCKGLTYKKVYNISARFEFLGQKLPQYIVHDSVFDERLCEVPVKDVKRCYKPVDRLEELRTSKQLDETETAALEFLELLKNYTDVPWSNMGISGSLLVNLHTLTSDIDPVVYGTKNSHKAYKALKALQQDAKSAVKPYSTEELRKLYHFRYQDTRVSFKDFMRTESRKVLQGKFEGRDYFVRLVKDWSEIQEEYGVVRYRNIGYARIRAEIEDDSEAILTPCSYKLKRVEVLEGVRLHSIKEVASFRGRFCEQARIGEVVIAQGKVEHVIDNKENREYFRLLLGNKPSDFMVLA